MDAPACPPCGTPAQAFDSRADASTLPGPTLPGPNLPGPTLPKPTLPEPTLPEPTLPERALAVRRAAARLCLQMGWSPVHEVPLPNHRRADILALRPDGGFVCIEVKSGARDFQTDGKWPEYREFSDALFFAVDADFPKGLLPDDTGLIVAHGRDADIVRDAPSHPLSAARRRALLQRFAALAAQRLAWFEDPEAMGSLRAALRAE